MQTVAGGNEIMAKAKGRPKLSVRNDRTAKIDATILGRAEVVAKSKGITVAEYLSETLRGPVARDLAALTKRMEKEGEAN
jgi:hypothetical protein